MHLVVGVTDTGWFDFLSARPALREINFWRPQSRQAFRGLEPGEPFLFKLKAPIHAIAGGAFFVEWRLLPIGLAWDAFGEGNGAASFSDLVSRIERYRVGDEGDHSYKIGCILLSDPFWFHESDWIAVPPDWSPNIVSTKGYDTGDPIGKDLWYRVTERLRSASPPQVAEAPEPYAIPIEAMFGTPRPVRPRLGQGAFRALVTDTYEYRCAVTGGKILPVLEAAHIRPVAAQGTHDVRNGVLLRSDVHTLFDRGYVTITPDGRFRASPRLKDEFDNGEAYRSLDGRSVWQPSRDVDRPDRSALEWHNDVVYRG